MKKVTQKTFSVTRKKKITYKPNAKELKKIEYFSDLLGENFSMSEELAKAIGTVVVQALTENAKDESADLGLSEDDLGLDSEEDENLPESSRDAGKVEAAEGPKNAPDLSQDFAELKSTVNNHSIQLSEAEKHREAMKLYFSDNIIM